MAQSLPTCGLHRDCIEHVLYVAKIIWHRRRRQKNCERHVHQCHTLFCSWSCLRGLVTGLHPYTERNVTASRVCTPREAEDKPDGLEAEFLLPRGEAIPVPIQFELGTAADHVSACIDTHIRQDNRWGVLVVELYSGCGNHSRHVARALHQVLYVQEGDNFRLRRGPVGEVTAKRRPPVVVLSIDRKAHPAGTSLVVDARGLTAENLGKLKAIPRCPTWSSSCWRHHLVLRTVR